MQQPTYAELRDLLRVIAIDQSQEHEGLKISLLALEVYDDGCTLKLLLQRAHALPVSQQQLQHADVSISDDRGAAYVGDMSVLHGSCTPDSWQYQASYTFMPTLDPAARELRIEIPAVQVGAIGWARGHRDAQSPGETTQGPWSFSVHIPAAPGT